MHEAHRQQLGLERKIRSVLGHKEANPPLYSVAMIKDQFFNKCLPLHSAETHRIAKACQAAKFMTYDASSKSSQQVVSPETDAATFYLIEHYLGLLEKKYPKHQLITEERHRALIPRCLLTLTQLQLRSLYYLIVICTRESRHSHYDASEMEEHLKEHIGKRVSSNHIEEYCAFFNKIRGKGSSKAQELFYKTGLSIPFHAFIRCTAETFNTKFSTAYGGKPWHNIAMCVQRAVVGDTSIHAMVDTSYTLAHNTGAIFNKGFIYHHQDTSGLIYILDLQRAGALPQAIRSGELSEKTYHSLPKRTPYDEANIKLIYEIVDAIYDLDPEHPQKVDWKSVVSLGAVGDYSDKVTKQMEEEKWDNLPQGFKPTGLVAWHPKKPKIQLLTRTN